MSFLRAEKLHSVFRGWGRRALLNENGKYVSKLPIKGKPKIIINEFLKSNTDKKLKMHVCICVCVCVSKTRYSEIKIRGSACFSFVFLSLVFLFSQRLLFFPFSLSSSCVEVYTRSMQYTSGHWHFPEPIDHHMLVVTCLF